MATFFNNSSSYAGFLNGYIAGNLSAHSEELSFHVEKIMSFLKDLNVEINKWGLESEQEKVIQARYKAFSSISTKENSLDFFAKLGDAVDELLGYIYICKPTLPSTASFVIKKIIYHFLNIAKTLKATAIKNQAKRIADKFELSAS